jgi:hypothetical protein
VPYGSAATTGAKADIRQSKCVAARIVMNPPLDIPTRNTFSLLATGLSTGIVLSGTCSIGQAHFFL